MYLYIFHLDTVRVPGPEDGFHQFGQLCPIPTYLYIYICALYISISISIYLCPIYSHKNVFKLSLKEKGDRFKESVIKMEKSSEPVIENGKGERQLLLLLAPLQLGV